MTTNTEIIERLVGIETRQKIDSKRIAEIHESVYGNGEPEKGIAVRVVLVEKWIGTAKRFLWLAIGATVTSVITLLLTLLHP